MNFDLMFGGWFTGSFGSMVYIVIDILNKI